MNLGHPFLIYGLCQRVVVPLEDNVEWIHPIKAIMIKRDKPGVPRPKGECTARAMNPRTRMIFMSIRLILNSRAVLKVTLGSLPLTHHRHGRPRWRPHLVSAPILRTRCSHSLIISMLFGTRPRSTKSSLPRIWRHSALTCMPSLLTRRPFSEISSPFRTSSLSFLPSTSHRRNDVTNHQGSFLHPLLFFYSQWGHWTHVWGGGGGGGGVVIGFC